MRQRIVSAVVMAGFCVGVTSGASAQGKGKPSPPPPVPVQAVIHDFDATSAPLLLQSDGPLYNGTYYETSDIKNEIWSSNGDWELDLSGQTDREVYLTFAPLSGPAALNTGYYSARIMSRCFDEQQTATGFLQIAEGGKNERCSLRIALTDNGTNYFMVMSPLRAGTGWVTVSCPIVTGVNTPCEHWTIEPGTDPLTPNPGVAALYSITTKNHKDVLEGFYNLSFFIDITR